MTNASIDHETAVNWPIVAALLPLAPTLSDGRSVQDAGASEWAAALSAVATAGFTEIDLTDTWLRHGDLNESRRAEFNDVLLGLGLRSPAASLIRRSVIDPIRGDENLAYSHRAIDAAAELGCEIVSVGLHRPLNEAQRAAQWFWTEDGPSDKDEADVRRLAALRLGELCRHAADRGMQLSLEMYEDTLLGSAESAMRLLEEIDDPAAGLNPDLGNLYRLPRPVSSFLDELELCAPSSNYWHVKSYMRYDDGRDLRFAVPSPMEFGSIDYRSAIRVMLDAGYRGAICVEHYGGDGLSIAAENRDYLRHLLRAEATASLTRIEWKGRA